MLEKSSEACDTNREKITDESHDERIPWDQYFMVQAVLLSLRGTCTRLEIGTTLVREKRITVGSYNEVVSGDAHCIDEGCYVVNGHCLRMIRTGMNTFLQCARLGIPTEGSETYIIYFPCLVCTKALLQVGMEKINYLHGYRNDPYAQALIEQPGISVYQVVLDPQHFPKLRNELTGKHV